MLKLQLALELYVWKKHIENKAKQRWYYNYLPKPVTYGFTLAEILITLTIVGVIASLTIPSLVNNINNATNVAQLKKTFATLQQAFNLIALDAGGSIVDAPGFSSTTGSAVDDANAMNAFATRLNVIKNCGSSMGCWYPSPLKWLGGEERTANTELTWNGGYGKAILADGTMMLVEIYGTSCVGSYSSVGSPLYESVCGQICIDVNGSSGPNQYGRDFFVFWITKTGIYPYGTFNDGTSCDINSSDWETSIGCAGKVLTEGAMNY